MSWDGLPVTLRVQVRRFFCGDTACLRRIFAERLPHVVERYARRSCGGARLAALGLPVGRTALRALVRAVPPPAEAPPRVVGIDEWAWRRGHRFGTILVDLERHRMLDLLADRSVESAAWLRQRPNVIGIVHDRCGLNADAASSGAPGRPRWPTADT